MQKKWLYILVIAGAATGMAWLLWNVHEHALTDSNAVPGICLFQRVTHLPCPSCGSTRAVMHITQLEFREAFYTNPIGFLLVAGLVLPFWILYDVATRRSTFYNCYSAAEVYVRKPWIATLLAGLVAINWIWNIYKF